MEGRKVERKREGTVSERMKQSETERKGKIERENKRGEEWRNMALEMTPV